MELPTAEQPSPYTIDGQLQARVKKSLSDVQVAEIKKAFSMVDQDGSGSIDASELQSLMRALLNEEPSDTDIQQVLLLVDTNRDGQIQFTEFLSAMCDWLQEDSDPQSRTRKRVRNESDERHDTHKKIKHFFTQVRKSSSFFEVRQKLQAEAERAAAQSYHSGEMDVERGGFRSAASRYATSVQKLEALNFAREAILQFGTLSDALNSPDPAVVLEAVRSTTRLLSLVELFESPYERRKITEVLVKSFELCVQHSVPQRLIKFLAVGGLPQLQLEAVRALTLFCGGPLIAGTPPDSVFHPQQMFFKGIVICENVVPACISLLSSPHDEVREAAVVALGTLAARNARCRDAVLASHALTGLLQLCQQQAKLSLLRRLAWTVSVLCGVTHQTLPDWDTIRPSFPYLSQLLMVDDEEILLSVLETLAIVLPGTVAPTEDGRLVQLLQCTSAVVIRATLSTLETLVRLDDRHVTHLVRLQLLPALVPLLSHTDSAVRCGTLAVLGPLAGGRGHVQGLLDAHAAQPLLALLQASETRRSAAQVLTAMTRGASAAQLRRLVDAQAIRSLSGALAAVKEYDHVLNDVYKFHGASYDLELVGELLHALQSIVTVGEVDAEEESRAGSLVVNRYAVRFDLEAVDRFGQLLATLASSQQQQWRSAGGSGGGGGGTEEKSIEERLRWLLVKLKRAHDLNTRHDPVSKHVSSMIVEIWRKYLSPETKLSSLASENSSSSSAASPPPPTAPSDSVDAAMMRMDATLLVKIQFDEDIRVHEMPESMTYAELRSMVDAKFGRPELHVTYRDEEGDYVTIDDQLTLAKALAVFRKQRSKGALRLHLFELNSHSSAAVNRGASGTDLNIHASSPPSSTLSLDSPHRGAPPPPAAAAASTMEITPALFGLPAAAASLADALKQSVTMTPEDVERLQKAALFESLEKHTHFGRTELEQLHTHWASQAVGEKLTKQQFADGLRQLGVTDPLTLEQNWAAFDVNKDGSINFREFVCGLSTILRGTADERLRFTFQAYDADGSGYLEPAEVTAVFRASLLSRGTAVSADELSALVRKIFDEIDVDHDGRLSFEEFKRGVKTQSLLANCFVNSPTTPASAAAASSSSSLAIQK